MTDIEVKNLTGTVSFSKKISDGNYGGEEAGFYLQFEVAPEDSISDIVSKAQDAAAIVKQHVYAELGVGIAEPARGVEAALVAFVGAQVEAPVEVTSHPSAATYAQPPVAAPQAAAGVPARCTKCGGSEFWDNRPKKASGQFKATSPDFKCKNQACGEPVWPPKAGR